MEILVELFVHIDDFARHFCRTRNNIGFKGASPNAPSKIAVLEWSIIIAYFSGMLISILDYHTCPLGLGLCEASRRDVRSD